MPQLRLVKNIDPQRGSNPKNLFTVGDVFFFEANGDELWLSDGTEAGTRLVKEFDLSAADDIGKEEYRSASTKLAMASLDGKLFFRSRYRDNGSEVFVSDGTSAGTGVLNDIRQGISSYAADFEVIGDKLFFRAENNNGKRAVFVTDGTPAGTKQVSNLNPSGNDLPYKSFLTGFKGIFTIAVFPSTRMV